MVTRTVFCADPLLLMEGYFLKSFEAYAQVYSVYE